MKYSIPLKKLLPLVQDELTKDSLHQISKIPIDLKDNNFFKFFQYHFSYQCRFDKDLDSDSINQIDFDYNKVSEEIKNVHVEFFKKFILFINEIDNNKSSFTPSSSREKINRIFYEPEFSKYRSFQGNLPSFSIRSAKEFLKYFSNAKQILYFSSIVQNTFLNSDINLILGDENGMPESIFQSEKDIKNIISLMFRPTLPEYININTDSSPIIVNALFPNTAQVTIDEVLDTEFSFKNDEFINTINEEILDDTFLRVANMESILVNLDSYLEDIDSFAQKYGYDAYLSAMNNTMDVTSIIWKAQQKVQTEENDFSLLLQDFYYFISLIPEDIIHDPENLNLIIEKINKKLPSLDNQIPLPIPQRYALEIRKQNSNLSLLISTISSREPLDIHKILNAIPDINILSDLQKYHNEKLKNGITGYIDSSLMREIYERNFSKEEVEAFLSGPDRDKWTYAISELPTSFNDTILAIPAIHNKIIDNMFSSVMKSLVSTNIREHTSSDRFKNIISSLSFDEVDNFLNKVLHEAQNINIKYDSSNPYLRKDSNDKVFLNMKKNSSSSYNLKSIDILDDIMKAKNNYLVIQFIEYIVELDKNPDNSELKENCIKSLMNVSEYLQETQHYDFSIPSPSFIQEHFNKKLDYHKVQEFFIFNVMNSHIFDNIPPQLAKSLFARPNETYVSYPMQNDASFYLDYIKSIKEQNRDLFKHVLSFIKFDELLNSKEDFSSNEWMDILKNNSFGGNKGAVIQKIISQSEDNIKKLIECQKMIRNHDTNYTEFKISSKNLELLQQNPEFPKYVGDILQTSHNMLEKISPQLKYNPEFWISLITKNYDKKDSIIKPISYIEPFLLEDVELLKALAPIYYSGHMKNSMYEICRKFENNFKELLKKPRFFLPFLEDYSNNEFGLDVLSKLQPDIFKFMNDNKIPSSEIYQKINVLVQQSGIQEDLTNHNIQPGASKQLKF